MPEHASRARNAHIVYAVRIRLIAEQTEIETNTHCDKGFADVAEKNDKPALPAVNPRHIRCARVAAAVFSYVAPINELRYDNGRAART